VDVASWLRDLGLERYENAFRENEVGAEDLCHLTAEGLEGIGVAAIGHRRRLLVAIAKLQDGNDAPPPTVSTIDNERTPTYAGERRQLTVMFCDLVGSTALSEKLDPEELHGLLHSYRTVCGDVIARYEGFVARYVGDGILTYFGWPTAHEEDAERAVRAALEIVQTVKRASTTEDLSVRIGIATGPVVVGEQAGSGDQSKLAVGSTPNLAARLQGLAVADQIVITTSTRRLVGNAFELTDLGEHELKGIAEPVHAWRVERASVTDSRFDARYGAGGLTPLVGREDEVGLLLRRWSQAKDGEGQVLLLSGEPGIGKSRILSTLRERLEAEGVQALRFQCSPYYVKRRRRCNSGMTSATKSSRPAGTVGNMMLNPSQASVFSHNCITSAISTAVPTISSPPKPPTNWASCRTVMFFPRASATSVSRPLWLWFDGGISGNGASRSKREASMPSRMDRLGTPLSGCTRLSSKAFFCCASSLVCPAITRAPGKILT
jgi:class 3 adenylate cyclase